MFPLRQSPKDESEKDKYKNKCYRSTYSTSYETCWRSCGRCPFEPWKQGRKGLRLLIITSTPEADSLAPPSNTSNSAKHVAPIGVRVFQPHGKCAQKPSVMRHYSIAKNRKFKRGFFSLRSITIVYQRSTSLRLMCKDEDPA